MWMRPPAWRHAVRAIGLFCIDRYIMIGDSLTLVRYPPAESRALKYATILARFGALSYTGWGVFHVYVSWQIASLALSLSGIAQGRMLQLAAYMLTIALFAIVVALWRNWRNDHLGHWLNLCVIGWADLVWVGVVVLPGYVSLGRGLLPPCLWVVGAICCAVARKLQPARE